MFNKLCEHSSVNKRTEKECSLAASLSDCWQARQVAGKVRWFAFNCCVVLLNQLFCSCGACAECCCLAFFPSGVLVTYFSTLQGRQPWLHKMEGSRVEVLARRVLDAAPQGPRQALLLACGASLQEAKAAFRRLSLLLHPDKMSRSVLAPEAFKAINTAFRELQAEASRTEAVCAGAPVEASRWTEFAACGQAETAHTTVCNLSSGQPTAELRARTSAMPVLGRWSNPVQFFPPTATPGSTTRPVSVPSKKMSATMGGSGPRSNHRASGESACGITNELGLLHSLLGQAAKDRLGSGAPCGNLDAEVHQARGNQGGSQGASQPASSSLPASQEEAARLRWARSVSKRPLSPAPAAGASQKALGQQRPHRTLVLSSSSSSRDQSSTSNASGSATSSAMPSIEASSQEHSPDSKVLAAKLPKEAGAAKATCKAGARAISQAVSGSLAAAFEPRKLLRRRSRRSAASARSAGSPGGRGRAGLRRSRRALTLVPV